MFVFVYDHIDDLAEFKFNLLIILYLRSARIYETSASVATGEILTLHSMDFVLQTYLIFLCTMHAISLQPGIRAVLIIFLVEERKDKKTFDTACLHKFIIFAKIMVLILCSLAPL